MRHPWFRRIALVILGVCASSIGFADDRGQDRESPLMIGEGAAPTADAVDYQVYGSPGQSGGTPTMVDQRETGRFIVSKTASDTWSVSERFGAPAWHHTFELHLS